MSAWNNGREQTWNIMEQMCVTNPLLQQANNAFKHNADTHCILLCVKDGLPHMATRPFANVEWATLPHAELTKNTTGVQNLWVPAALDHEHPAALTPDTNTMLRFELWDPVRCGRGDGNEHIAWRFCRHGCTLLKHKQGCPAKDRPPSATDGCLSVWHRTSSGMPCSPWR